MEHPVHSVSVPVSCWFPRSTLDWFLLCVRAHIRTVDSNGLFSDCPISDTKISVFIPCVSLALAVSSYWMPSTVRTGMEMLLGLEEVGFRNAHAPSVSKRHSSAAAAGRQTESLRSSTDPLGFWWAENNREKSFFVSKSHFSVIFLSQDQIFWQSWGKSCSLNIHARL